MTPSQVSTVVRDPASVDDAITSRFSARAFLPTPVPRETVEAILRVASRAPSGTNTQPWKVYVLQGASLTGLSDQVCAAHDAIYANPELAAEYREEYEYYPRKWVSPYIDRRRENGHGRLKDAGRKVVQGQGQFVGRKGHIDTLLGGDL